MSRRCTSSSMSKWRLYRTSTTVLWPPTSQARSTSTPLTGKGGKQTRPAVKCLSHGILAPFQSLLLPPSRLQRSSRVPVTKLGQVMSKRLIQSQKPSLSVEGSPLASPSSHLMTLCRALRTYRGRVLSKCSTLGGAKSRLSYQQSS